MAMLISLLTSREKIVRDLVRKRWIVLLSMEFLTLNSRQLHNKNSKNKNLHVDSERDNNNN